MKHLILLASLLTSLLSFNALAFEGMDTALKTFSKEGANIRVVVTSDPARVSNMVDLENKVIGRKAIHVAVSKSTIGDRIEMSYNIVNGLYRVGILVDAVTVEFSGVTSTAQFGRNPKFTERVDIP